MNEYRLTDSEIIARIETIAARYDNNAMILRDLLMIDFEYANNYSPPTNDAKSLELELIASFDAIDSSAQSFPNAFRSANQYERADAAEMLNYLMLLNRDAISQLRLSDSLCPLHACDYAICFDDDDAECAAIRSCFPNHDT